MKQIPPLPRDIKRHILKKIILYARKPLFWAAVMVAVNLSIRDRLAGVPVIRILLFIGTILLPFLVIGIPKHFWHKSIVGTVRTVHIQEETGTYSTGTRHWPYTKHVIYLDVETADGKHHRVKAREYGRRSHKGFSVPSEGDVQRHLNDYAEGETAQIGDHAQVHGAGDRHAPSCQCPELPGGLRHQRGGYRGRSYGGLH